MAARRFLPALVTAVAAGALVVTTLPAAAVSPSTGTQTATDAVLEPLPRAGRALITVRPRNGSDAVRRELFGVNHRYENHGGGSWNPGTDRPVREVVRGARRAGVMGLRFPGGASANLYEWRDAIGRDRSCQINARGLHRGHKAAKGSRSYGPDEFLRLSREIGARPVIMVPFVNGTPSEAANWVEYMNSPARQPGNPNGGRDWADFRARNGHPAPYNVRKWEIGNEHRRGEAHHWLSRNNSKAIKQYANGGGATLHEGLGKNCQHPRPGVASNGKRDQVFEMLYPPVAAPSVTVRTAGHVWRRVRNLNDAGPRARVYKLDATNGRVIFGDGRHGAIPPRRKRVKATYRTVHKGYFAYARAMKKVDRRIDVCATWDTASFARVARGRSFDCMAMHAITNFRSRGENRWRGRLDGHDKMMLALRDRGRAIRDVRRSLPRGTDLMLTEVSAINGDTKKFPHWPASASHAVYMADKWVAFLRMGLPWAMGDSLTYSTGRSVLGPRPHYTFTAGAVARQVMAPLFRGGGRVIGSTVKPNPIRNPRGPGKYQALTVAATRSRSGALYVLIVNNLPGRDIRTHVRIPGFPLAGRARMRTMRPPRFASWNPPRQRPEVKMKAKRVAVGRHGFDATLPEHSITLYRLARR